MLRSFGNANCDVWAAVEQLALVACVYSDDRPHAAEIVGQGGEILAWVHRPDTWPPSYALIRSGAGRYFLVVAGTTNAGQWAGHLQGTFGVLYRDGPAVVNGQWLAVWQQLRQDIAPLLPADPSTYTLHLSGHSYGGAVAHLGGIEWARDHGPDAAQVLTFGQPKVLTAGYTGPAPSAVWRVRSLQDAVGYIPTGSGLTWVLELASFLWRQQTHPWTHYGPDVWLSADGTFNAVVYPAPSPLPVGVSTGPVGEHGLLNYWGRLRAHYLASPGNPPDVAETLRITIDVIDGAHSQPVVPLPMTVHLDPAGVVAIPAGNALSLAFFAGNGAFTMSYPLPVDGGDIVKTTSFFVSKKQGWSESLLWWVTGTDDPLAACEHVAQMYHGHRKKILSDTVAIEGCRISVEGVAGDSILDEAPSLHMGPGEVSGQPANAQECWLFKVQDASGFVRDSKPVRGLPQEFVNVASSGSTRVESIPQPISKFRANLVKLLTTNWTVQNGAQVRAVLKSYNRDPVDNPIYTVKAWVDGPQGVLQLILNGPAPDLTDNSPIKHWHDKAKCASGVSGDYRIIASELAGGDTVITLNKRPRCPLMQSALFNGRVQKVETIYVPITEVYGGHISSHKVGAPFGATPGRRRGRC